MGWRSLDSCAAKALSLINGEMPYKCVVAALAEIFSRLLVKAGKSLDLAKPLDPCAQVTPPMFEQQASIGETAPDWRLR
jgi:hypothetical protein